MHCGRCCGSTKCVIGRSFYVDNESYVISSGGEESDMFSVLVGLRQGCAMAP